MAAEGAVLAYLSRHGDERDLRRLGVALLADSVAASGFNELSALRGAPKGPCLNCIMLPEAL
jgi:hypothetical protein